jgi:glycosyltransferase involved in cell wall biosynthesis
LPVPVDLDTPHGVDCQPTATQTTAMAPMRLAFLDSMGWTYTPDSAYERPLGGTQSALCYLTERLAASGHEVTLFNGVTSPTAARGVTVLPTKDERIGMLENVDALVVAGGCTSHVAGVLRRATAVGKLVLWTGHATSEPAVADLANPATRDLFDHFVFVSDWQKNRYQDVFGIPADRSVVLRNAIAPAFESLFPAGTPVLDPRPWPPVLAYTSTPYRGLNALLGGFPFVREEVPGTTLKVFSSMAGYEGTPAASDPYTSLYDQARRTEGVEYVGAVPQPRLAEELKRVSVLAYPNTYDETSCISVMEAMAAGCLIATCGRAALPETLAGFGVTLEPEADIGVFATNYAHMLVWLLPRLQAERPVFEERLRRQVDHVNATGTWTVRAKEWEEFLAGR